MPECFVISPIGEEDSETRRNADRALSYIITPPLEAAGYTVVRADKIEKTGIITTQIIEKVLECDLLVADLSGRNPNVFYELALRHAAKKPFIQIIRKGDELPFDVAATRTIRYGFDVEEANRAVNEIAAFIKTVDLNSADSPVSIAIDLYRPPADQSTVEQQVTKLRSEVAQILSEIQSSENRSSLHDMDDVMSILDEIHAGVRESNGAFYTDNQKILSSLLNNENLFDQYPRHVIVNRCASLVEGDLPSIASNIRQSLDPETGAIRGIQLHETVLSLEKLIIDLLERGIPTKSRLLATVELATSALKRIAEDVPPF
ncbi:hypothetical protein [Henriciella litoralis]|uniref:hypothetical protein n=1 Tax=Henriciella litoralis TaxID=568102 RepID=UPI000A0062CB|nr:hypothetical protein [Henriciella litoralis]